MDRPSFLEGGEQARLIPVAADSNREARTASILLATLLGLLGQRLARGPASTASPRVFCKNGDAEAKIGTAPALGRNGAASGQATFG